MPFRHEKIAQPGAPTISKAALDIVHQNPVTPLTQDNQTQVCIRGEPHIAHLMVSK